MRIGVVIAMDKEFRQVRSLLGGETAAGAEGMARGRIGDNDITLSRCGIGKVNAAIGTVELIRRFNPDVVVSTGVAGGVPVTLSPQDVVAAEATCYHDVYCGPECERGQVMGLPAKFICDARLVDKAKRLECGVRVRTGLIVTGDWFVDERSVMSRIVSHFPSALAVDMESAAIAQTCHAYSKPFISFRIISDVPLRDHKAQMYHDFWDTMAEKSFSVTKAFLEAL